MKRRPVRGWLILPVLAAALVLVPVPEWAVESAYARGIYPWLQSGVTFVSNLVPLAVLDLLIVGGLILTVLRLVFLWRGRRGFFGELADAARRLIRAVAVVVLSCQAMCMGVCKPATCESLGKDCGMLSDGCGGMLSCGTCVPPKKTCGGDGVPNVCGK